MNLPGEHESELLRRLLMRAEEGAHAEHIDHELIAQFAENALPQAERRRVIEHLADCSECRRVASSLLNLASAEGTTDSVDGPTIRLAAAEPERSFVRRYGVLALAASLLVAVTIALSSRRTSSDVAERDAYDSAQRLLAASNFTEARKVVSDAALRGTRSDRLQSLDAQAARQMPATLALAQAGRLTDFGVDVSGAVARDLSSELTQGLATARQSLAGIQGDDLESLVNRGHVALSEGRVTDALADFDKATALAPRDPFGWLGRGLANYLGDHLDAAEKDFRRAIALSPDSVAAHFNLAMTLQEQGRKTDALAEWNRLLHMKLTEPERKQVERASGLLQAP
ncbi:MAG: tetratricopeptide repeat protein [Pirellulales bacterium]